jgi:hypothetical protein
MRALLSHFSGAAAAIGLLAACQNPPAQPRVAFEDRPPSFSPSAYAGSGGATRQQVDSREFYQSNQSAYHQAQQGLAVEREQRRRRMEELFSSSGGSSAEGGGSSSGNDSEGGGRNYRDMRVTYDKLAGQSRSSGYNTIIVEGGGDCFEIEYAFGSTGYAITGPGDLTGRMINIRFDNGRPASVKNYHGGSGYCKVSRFSRR